MKIELLTPREVDTLLRYRAGGTMRLVKARRISFIRLPDGSIRIDASQLGRMLHDSTQGGER